MNSKHNTDIFFDENAYANVAYNLEAIEMNVL